MGSQSLLGAGMKTVIETKGIVNWIDTEEKQLGVTVRKPAGGTCDLVLPLEVGEGLQEGDLVTYRVLADEQGKLHHSLTYDEPPVMSPEEEEALDKEIKEVVQQFCTWMDKQE